MKTSYTMVYRHCSCGNTLVIVLTEQIFPALNDFWSIVRDLSEQEGIPVNMLVEKFAQELERYLLLKRVSGAD